MAAVSGPDTTNFTGVTIDTTPGAVDTWRRTGNDDATITTDDADPALRISNAVTSGSFGDQLFSPALDVPAIETGPRGDAFHAGSARVRVRLLTTDPRQRRAGRSQQPSSGWPPWGLRPRVTRS